MKLGNRARTWLDNATANAAGSFVAALTVAVPSALIVLLLHHLFPSSSEPTRVEGPVAIIAHETLPVRTVGTVQTKVVGRIPITADEPVPVRIVPSAPPQPGNGTTRTTEQIQPKAEAFWGFTLSRDGIDRRIRVLTPDIEPNSAVESAVLVHLRDYLGASPTNTNTFKATQTLSVSVSLQNRPDVNCPASQRTVATVNYRFFGAPEQNDVDKKYSKSGSSCVDSTAGAGEAEAVGRAMADLGPAVINEWIKELQ